MQTFKASEYIKIDIANNYGLDKLNWNDRLDWFNENENQLNSLLDTAESPAQMYAGIQAWNQYNNGIPTGHLVALDATSSVFQLIGILTGDINAMKLCNVLPIGSREDAYKTLFNRFKEYVGYDITASKDDIKQALMTVCYGSTAQPFKIFGKELVDVFYEFMNLELPELWEFTQVCLGIMDESRLSYDWIMPDNFHVHIKVIDTIKETCIFNGEEITINRKVNKGKKNDKSLGANLIHSCDSLIVREITRRCDYDSIQISNIKRILLEPSKEYDYRDTNNNRMLVTLWNHYKETGYLSARILDYITKYNVQLIDKIVISDLLSTLPSKPFKIISIHDSFKCHANYVNDLRKQYNLQLYLLAKSNLLANIMTQITGINVRISKSKYNIEEILNTDYALS